MVDLFPHELHEPAAIECFQAGKHVRLEEPMTPTLAACERTLAAAEIYDPLPRDPTEPKPVALRSAGGDTCIDAGAHWIRPQRMLLGEIEEAMAAPGATYP